MNSIIGLSGLKKRFINIIYIGCERYVIILHMMSNRQIISYDDAHAAIMVHAQNQKMAEKFISYLEQLNHINNAN